MEKTINLIGTISNVEVPFCKKNITEWNNYNLRGDGKYLFNRSAQKNGKYYSYIYYLEDGLIFCFDIFNKWRKSINREEFFTNNEFLEVI